MDHFFLYDNLSTDDWKSELEPEISAGIVEVRPWAVEPGQPRAYEDCLRRNRRRARWIAFIDVDEFLFCPKGHRLPDVLATFDIFPGVAVNWRCYGSNGLDAPTEGVVVENYPLRLPTEYPGNQFVKSVVYPRKTRPRSDGPHVFRHRGRAAVGEDRRPVYISRRDPPTTDLLRINHYFAKSERVHRRKNARPSAWDGAVGASTTGAWSDVPPDCVRDDTILQFASPLKEALARRAVPSKLGAALL